MFIVLEGVDGAGKSTQVRKLQDMLLKRGLDVAFVHFPRFDAPVYGELISRFLRGELGTLEQVNPYLVALLYAGDRADAAATIRRWMAEGKVVVADRYVYSNIGYQCAKVADEQERRRLAEWILDLEYSHYAIPRPDLSLFLDVPFRFTEDKLSGKRGGDDRSYLNGGADIHESSLELQRRVRAVYLEAAGHDPALRTVDCSDGSGSMASADEIFSRIAAIVEPVISRT
ncbi:MAG: dTMP kinase [Alistipes sp.]|nr:dTMP kinase [Alistipes sp.]